jgi:hypothetical protein
LDSAYDFWAEDFVGTDITVFPDEASGAGRLLREATAAAGGRGMSNRLSLGPGGTGGRGIEGHSTTPRLGDGKRAFDYFERSASFIWTTSVMA